MDAMITGFQILCTAGLALGAALTLYQQLTQRHGSQAGRFDHAVANDFEIGYRRSFSRA